MTFGIDVSGYQSGINYDQVRREGAEFVIIKAAGFNTGTLYSADGYHGHVDAARKAGLCIGHYYVVGEGDPEVQADFLTANLHDFDAAHDVIALDDEPLNDNGTYWRQDDALKFFTRVHKRTGIPWNRLWLYCPAHLTRENGPWEKITDKGIRVWWSAYGNDPTGHEPDHEPNLDGKIARWDIHQYSSSVPIAGRKTIDANYSRIPCAELFGGAEASTPASVPASTAKPTGATYTVKSGDTLFGIAEEMDMDWGDLYELNRGLIGINPALIKPGQVLRLSGSAPAKAAPSGGTYTVVSGDTLSGIAAKHGIGWEALYALNKSVIGSNPSMIKPGQRLRLGGTAPAQTSTYTVRSGDTLSGIASAHGTTWEKLYALNKATIGSDPSLIKPGQKLRLS